MPSSTRSASASSAPSPSLVAKSHAVAGRPAARPRPRPPRKLQRHCAGRARKRRRRRRGGTRADQAVDLIEQNPGITASEIAKTMKIKPNYLYRVLGDLEKEGRVKKKGREYHPAASAGLALAEQGRPQMRPAFFRTRSSSSDQAELADRVALLAQLGDAGVDPLAGEVGDLEALDDRPLAVRARAREAGRRSPRSIAVGAVGGTPIETQSPSGVPSTQSWTWSIAALAAEAALEAPRASMIAAPRLATLGMNSSAIQASSSTASQALSPSTLALTRSGYWVVEWLPQTVMLVTVGDRLAELVGELGDRPVVVEAHHRGEALARARRARSTSRSGSWCWPGCRRPAP